MADTASARSKESVARARERARQSREASYPSATEVALECDLVMKGGITSGVVYPLAACELARTRRFVNIGGSSAGAIAACFVAAAECGRDTGGFSRLAALPDEIGPNLPKLFTPGPHTRTAHAALMAWLDKDATKRARIRRVVITFVRAQARLVVGGCLVALVVAIVAGLLLAGIPNDALMWVRFVAITAIFFTMVVGAVLAWAMWTEARATKSGMEAQGFGICVGSDGGDPRPVTTDQPGALTDWLSAHIDLVAGTEQPLLVSDLQTRGINLQVMTTNLTHGRPMCFPFTDDRFMFDPVELGAYFPPAVIEALIDAQEPVAGADVGAPGVEMRSANDRPLYRLPAPEKLPVVLAARISLSFPALISAVPLYAVDRARKNSADRRAVRCWFSDGGITSNFPVHFFDSLWPRRPTFALDLGGYPPDEPDQDVSYAAAAPREPSVTPIASLSQFVAAILDTMEYWADEAQCALPGYRDRIVEVHLRPDEGGMNLQMSADVIAMVAEKGRQAAEALSKFDFDQHRWTRYLISMGRLQDAIELMDERYGPTKPGQHDGVRDLVDRAGAFSEYAQTAAWSGQARTRTEELLRFAIIPAPDFTAGDVPEPAPVLRITPRF